MTTTPRRRHPHRCFRHQPVLRLSLLALTIGACFGAAQASPVGPQVVNGQASFSQQGNVFSITNTPNAIINWQSFSVNAGEVTRFIQQSGSSAVLNRITGQDPSRILGALESNGKVFLINPNGIVFGRDARVDVGGLVASSLALSNGDFLAGKNNFTAGAQAGAVSNAGAIATPGGGKVLLIAPDVSNSGIITAPNGEVVLAAGRSVQLADSANPAMQVVVSAPADQAVNLGQIVAQGGKVGIYGALLSQRGVVNANSAVVGQQGQIMLKASGRATLDAGSVTSATGSGKGGSVTALGQQVGLTGDARVDASGAAGGGSVLIGGDYQGRSAVLPNAQQTYVGQQARIAADATGSGDGGKVIVWSDQATRMHGSVSARGAGAGGGGLVETSGHYLDVAGARVDAGAASGRRGTWLLDPYDIKVKNNPTTTLDDVAVFLNPPANGETVVDADLLSNSLANVVLQATHNIAFERAVDIGAANVSLAAQAGNDISVTAPITTRGGAMTLSANDNGAGTATGSGTVTIGSPLMTYGGNLHVTGANIIFNSGGRATVDAGDVSLRSNIGLGSISLTSGSSITAATGVAGRSTSLEAASISVDNGISGGGTLKLKGDRLTLNDEVSADLIKVQPYTARPISIGGSCVEPLPCLQLNNLRQMRAPSLVIGSSDPADQVGDINIAALTGNYGDNNGRRNALTTRIALLTSGGVAQRGLIDVSELAIDSQNAIDLPLLNVVGNLAARTGQAGASIRLNSATGINLARLGGSGYQVDGIISNGGTISLASLGAIGQAGGGLGGGVIRGASASLAAAGGIGSAEAPLQTELARLSADNVMLGSNKAINIRNNQAAAGRLDITHVAQSGMNNAGAISIENNGETVLAEGAEITSKSGAIRVAARSLLNINGSIRSDSGAVTLEAGANGLASDRLTFGSNATLRTGGDLTLRAGDAISVLPAQLNYGGRYTYTPFMNGAAVPPGVPPSVPPGVPPGTPATPVPPASTPGLPSDNPVVTVPPAATPGVPSSDNPVVTVPPAATPGVPSSDNPVVTVPPAATPGVPSSDNPVVTVPSAATPGVPSSDNPLVTVPPTQDLCALNASLPICQVVLPPTVNVPLKPLTRASDAAVNVILSNPPGQPRDKQNAPDKADDKRADKLASNEPGAKNESVKKLYCN